MCQEKKISSDFFAAEGATWLPEILFKHPYCFKGALSIIRQALDERQAYSAASEWVKLTLKCQKKVTETINQGNENLVDLWRYIYSNAGLLLDHLENMSKTGHQANVADAQDQSAATVTRTSKEEGLTKRNMSASEDNNESNSVIDTAANEWSPEQKKAWATTVGKVIKGFDNLFTTFDMASSTSDRPWEFSVLQGVLREQKPGADYNSTYRILYVILEVYYPRL
jgi:hypothetical protein